MSKAMKKIHFLLLLYVLSFGGRASATIFPLNIFQPYDPNVYKSYRGMNVTTDFNVAPEFGLSSHGYPAECVSKDETTVNVLRLWQEKQNALAMLKGFAPNSEIGSLAQQLNVDFDNGIRGHICFTGDLDVKYNVSLSNRWYLPENFILGFYLPVTSLKLCSNFKDLTQEITAEDFLTKSLLTDNLAANIERLGCGYRIGSWETTGIGDFSVILDWAKAFPQDKPLLKNVRTRARFGLSFPTGKQQDPDEIMSIPLGNDGALGLVFGFGLDLRLIPILQCGVDVEFLQLFSDVRERRIKTDVTQTDLLLLAKADAIKDFGFTHHFNLYLEFFRFAGGLSAGLTYQFWKHEDDKLAVLGNKYSNDVANSAKSLEEWTMHNLIYKVSYDFDHGQGGMASSPYLAFFYKQPINGKNAIMASTAGFVASLSF
jgi:hypothetical protein